MQGRWMYVAGVALALLLAFFMYRKYRVPPELSFPDLRVTDLQGGRSSIRQFAGKPMVLSFAASWCGPCIKELKALREAGSQVTGIANVVVISDEDLSTIAGLRERGDFPFHFLKLEGSFSSIGINSIPTTYLLNARGEIVKQEVGYIDWADASNRTHLLKLMSNDH